MKRTNLMKKTVSLALSVFLTLSTLLVIPFGSLTVSAADVKGWADSANGVYYIATPEDLLQFKNDSAVATNPDAKVYLTANIDMSGVTWTPVDSARCTFDGNGYTIKGLSYTHTAGAGKGVFVNMFAGTLKNVRFEDGTFNTTATTSTYTTRYGGVVGQTYSDDSSAKARFENVYAEFTVNAEGKEAIGGFIGRALNPTELINCVSECTVIGGQYVGGFAGITRTTISFTNCVSKTTVTGTNNVGGFIGRNESGTLTLISCADGSKVNGTSASGGFIGDTKIGTTTNLTDCLSYGTYSATGGNASCILAYARGNATLTRCVSMATATNPWGEGTALVSLRSESAESHTPAKNALASDPNADISAYVNKIALIDCYFDKAETPLAVFRHSNKYFRCIDLSVTYSDGNNTDLSSEMNGYCDVSMANYASHMDASKPFSDAVRTINADDLKISDYGLLVNWVETANGLLAPADVVDLMVICPIPSDLHYQVTTAENADGTKNVRFIAVINELEYANVGFHVQVTRTNGSVTETSDVLDRRVTTVYASVEAAGETVTAEELNGKYIVAVVINNIDYANYEHTFKISAYVTMNDANGTVLETESTIVTLAQKTIA